MLNQMKAEMYKLRHSQLLLITLSVAVAIIAVSFVFGEMTFFGGGDGMVSVIGFQAKSYVSEAGPTFQEVARSSLAYTAFFWIVIGIFTALFFIKEYNTGTIKLSAAYGTNKAVLYYCKAITIFIISFLLYFGFIAIFFGIEVAQSGYIPIGYDLWNMLGWMLLCWIVMLAFQCVIIFLCVLLQNTGVVVGVSCLYIFSGASVYLMTWSNMESVALPLKCYIYSNPMYYWMNFCSCRTIGFVSHLMAYLIGCIVLLICGGMIISKKEIK